MKKKLLVGSLVLATSTSMASNVLLDNGTQATFDGFASIVVGQTLDDNEVFLAEPISGGVYDDELSFNKESIFGLKSSIKFNDKLSFTVQAVARSAQNFNVEIDRSYITYQINQNWKVSAGKKNLVFFKYSDYLDVGYAYNFMRPPVPIYILPFNNYDGASITYDNHFGDYDFSIETYTGTAKGIDSVSLSGVNSKLTFDFQNIYGIVFNLYAEDWDVRVGAHSFELQSDLVGDISTLTAINGGMISQADADALGLMATDVFIADGDPLVADNNKASWITGSGSYSPENLMMSYEFFLYRDDLGFNDQDSHFVNIGYRLGKWTPTISWSSAKEKQDQIHAVAPIGINKGAPKTHYETLGLTLRYEVEANVAAKFDVTSFKDKGETLTFGDSTLLSAGIYITF